MYRLSSCGDEVTEKTLDELLGIEERRLKTRKYGDGSVIAFLVHKEVKTKGSVDLIDDVAQLDGPWGLLEFLLSQRFAHPRHAVEMYAKYFGSVSID